jgi:sugar phosphate permease
VLTFAYLVSYTDRQVFTLLMEPIREDFNISDTKISLLGGFAFVIFYTFMGIPIGWLADQKNRRLIIIAGKMRRQATGLNQTITSIHSGEKAPNLAVRPRD